MSAYLKFQFLFYSFFIQKNTDPPLKEHHLQANIYFLSFWGKEGREREILSAVGNLTHFDPAGNSQADFTEGSKIKCIMETSTLIMEQILMPQEKVHYKNITWVTLALSDTQGGII